MQGFTKQKYLQDKKEIPNEIRKGVKMRPVSMKIKVNNDFREVFAFDHREAAPNKKRLISELFESIKTINFTFHYLVQFTLIHANRCLKIKTSATDLGNRAAFALAEAHSRGKKLDMVTFSIINGTTILDEIHLIGVTVKSIKSVGKDKEVTTLKFEKDSWDHNP